MKNRKLPETWKKINLEDYIITLESGKRPKGGAVSNGVPSLGGEHINNFGEFNIKSDKLKYVPRDFYEKMKSGIIKEGDILVVKDGATTGKVAFVDTDFILQEACINEHVFLLRTNKDICGKFLAYYLRSNLGQRKILNNFRGATVGGISKEFINFNMLLPPLEIQKKIVQMLEKAEDALKKKKEAVKLLDELVKSRFIEMFGNPVKNPMKLPKVKLENLGDWKTGGTPLRSESKYYNGNIPWLSSGELNSIYCFNSAEMITKLAIKESSAKIIEKGSLLLGMYDTAALKSTINMIECSCNQAIAYAKLDPRLVNTIYSYYCIQIGKDFYKSQQRGVRQKNLNLSMIKGLEIIMPNLQFQNQFADFVKHVDKLKFEMEKTLKKLEDNFNSLMQKAFNGELEFNSQLKMDK
ncbi:restriction endonuclease subunit S [Clostridium sp. WLY-B-L2]|uniref:Restriction endonuclease subunit S n=1 Tax=Clostridium aromativorans TaxID=2836848 RepID=A0ABS8NAZ4_9CLOT|nr:restriction endonuclease subunit S [Clostridium aromativorans]MCC9296225.1 restriction endonuclease subunit S [Clostridium aromativorans]